MFSMIITAESTMIPKSTAPTDSRLASCLQHQDDDGEKQSERDIGADDDGAAQIAEKHPLNEENQQAAEDQVVQHGVRGDPDQRASVVVGNELNPWRQLPSLLSLSISSLIRGTMALVWNVRPITTMEVATSSS